eukprot:symbB.v1.2.015197.t1/scaffold1129.1/size136302/5
MLCELLAPAQHHDKLFLGRVSAVRLIVPEVVRSLGQARLFQSFSIAVVVATTTTQAGSALPDREQDAELLRAVIPEDSRAWADLQLRLEDLRSRLGEESGQEVFQTLLEASNLVDEANEITAAVKEEKMKFEVELVWDIHRAGAATDIVVIRLMKAKEMAEKDDEDKSQASQSSEQDDMAVTYWTLLKFKARLDQMRDCFDEKQKHGRWNGSGDCLRDPWMEPSIVELRQRLIAHVDAESKRRSASKATIPSLPVSPREREKLGKAAPNPAAVRFGSKASLVSASSRPSSNNNQSSRDLMKVKPQQTLGRRVAPKGVEVMPMAQPQVPWAPSTSSTAKVGAEDAPRRLRPTSDMDNEVDKDNVSRKNHLNGGVNGGFKGFQLPKKPHLLQQVAYSLYRIALTLLRFRWVLQWPGAFLQSPMGSAGQSLCEIARAAQQEKEDSEMVRRCLPARIDALLPQEMALCFEHELWQMLLSVAEASRSFEANGRWCSAHRALQGGLRCLWEALQGFEARLSARELCVGSDGNTVVLGKERRNELQGHFSSDLSELLAAAIPSCAKIAQSPVTVATEAKKHLTCVMEAWDAVLTCKTHITDLYMDNDELSKARLEDLILDASKILDVEAKQELILEEKDVQCVHNFLLVASKSEVPEVWEIILQRLRRDWTTATNGKAVKPGKMNSVWVEVAGNVLEELKDVLRKEEMAARRIQRCFRCHRSTRKLKGRCSDVHEMPVMKSRSGKSERNAYAAYEMPVVKNLSGKSASSRRRSSMFSNRPARWSQAHFDRVAWRPSTLSGIAAETLSFHLLSEGLDILSMEMPTIEAVTQFHRHCTALDALNLDSVSVSPTELVAFWLNIRNLSVIIALLQLCTQSLPCKLPNTFEEWVSCLSHTSLFVHGQALGPADIDHHVLGVGCLSLLPPPPRRSLLLTMETRTATTVKRFLPWPVFGLWLPIEFGSPKLYIFKAETVLEQLRSSAEDFLDSCKSVGEVKLEVPPTLRSTAAIWQPLLKSRGSFSVAFEPRAVNWTFKAEAELSESLKAQLREKSEKEELYRHRIDYLQQQIDLYRTAGVPVDRSPRVCARARSSSPSHEPRTSEVSGLSAAATTFFSPRTGAVRSMSAREARPFTAPTQEVPVLLSSTREPMTTATAMWSPRPGLVSVATTATVNSMDRQNSLSPPQKHAVAVREPLTNSPDRGRDREVRVQPLGKALYPGVGPAHNVQPFVQVAPQVVLLRQAQEPLTVKASPRVLPESRAGA